MLYVLFSLKGRIGRREYHRYGGSAQLGTIVFIIGGLAIGVLLNWWTAAGIIIMAAALIGTWAGFALRVKRIHDLDRSGWALLITSGLGRKEGSEGLNRYGWPYGHKESSRKRL